MSYQPVPQETPGDAVTDDVSPLGVQDSGGIARRLAGVLKGGLYRLLTRAEIAGAGGNVVSSATDGGKERLDTFTALEKWLGSTAPTVGQKAMAASIPVVISSDQSAIPIGSQSDIDDEMVFSLALDVNMSSSGSDNPLLLIRNPALSGVTLYVLQALAGVGTTNQTAVFRLFIDPTITANGTSETPANRLAGATATSAMDAYTLPTVSANGTTAASLMNGQNQNSVIFSEDYNFAVKPGHDLLVTGDPKDNNRTAVLTVSWVEK